jgi:hypothetical protein
MSVVTILVVDCEQVNQTRNEHCGFISAAAVVMRVQGHLSDISQVKLGTKCISECLNAGSIKRIPLVHNVKTFMLISHLYS